jgi:two-component system NtrC family sensor kinase
MGRSLQTRGIAILLALMTAAAVALAIFNYRQEQSVQVPTDGVTWFEGGQGLVAQRVQPGSSGQHAGIKPGDELLSVNQQPTPHIANLVREQYHTKVYGSISYVISRHGIRFDVPVILDATNNSFHTAMRLIALIYLGIGLYVLFRRWTAPHATHFYIFCLASFVAYSFWYTGRLNFEDWVIYWGWIVAGAVQPALFLHFALSFRQRSARSKALLLTLTYGLAAGVVGLQIYALTEWQATGLLEHRLDQIALGYLASFYILASVLFTVQYRRAGTDSGQVLLRQQLKWLARGSVLSVVPFSLLYVLPYLLDKGTPDFFRDLAILSLVILPLTFAWAIVRYRLMDVDLIFKRGVTYTLATAALFGFYFVVVAVAAETVHARLLPSAGAYGLLAALIVTSALFEPVKRRIQNRVDRVFDRKRYDYRQTLIEFGRGLGTQTDLRHLLDSITGRLSQTLLVGRVAVFLANENGEQGFSLAATHGLPPAVLSAESRLALEYLDFDQPGSRSHIFFENPTAALHLSRDEQSTAALLDLHYYLPCEVQDRTIAVIGLGRTTDGDFLSSEDVELLESLAGYVGIAIQNATLYASLQTKIAEFERLKEFNENIVESSNVGILAVDLEDHIESWNAQMEVLFAMPRSLVIGKRLQDVFDQAFLREFDRVRNEPGVHHLYKFPLGGHDNGAPELEGRITNISVAPLVSREFHALGRIILIDDITARVGLESQLAQAEKLSSIGLLAAGVAHEVNTPLAVISSYTQMLTKQLRGRGEEGDRLAPLLDKITKQTFRASEIVNGLLNFSRTGGSEFRSTDLNHVVQETLGLLEHQFKIGNIELLTEFEEELPEIQGNSGKLQQVFLNLLLNAKDAMPSGGRLRVATRAGDSVTVTITDSGSGIAPEHVQRIYDPFFTTKTAPKEGERRGTGLGLAVTYGIMQEHTGKIHVESQPGAGTTFALEFPLKVKHAHV